MGVADFIVEGVEGGVYGVDVICEVGVGYVVWEGGSVLFTFSSVVHEGR
jgi:hypothetical protein